MDSRPNPPDSGRTPEEPEAERPNGQVHDPVADHPALRAAPPADDTGQPGTQPPDGPSSHDPVLTLTSDTVPTAQEPTDVPAQSAQDPETPSGSAGPTPTPAGAQDTQPPLPPAVWVRPGAAQVTEVPSGTFQGRICVNEAGAIGLETINHLARRPPRLAATPLRNDVALDSGTIGSLKFACASSRGLAHYTYRTVREDAYAMGTSPDEEWLVVVLADGVGGSYLPDFAADEAAKKGYNATIRALASCDDGHPRSVEWADVVEVMRCAVEERARELLPPKTPEEERQGATARALADVAATTADIIAVHTRPDPDGTVEYMRLGVAGDGSALVLDPEKGWRVVAPGKQESDGLVSNAVVPLPLDPGIPQPQYGRLAPGQALVCCTDGYGDPLGDGNTSVGYYFLDALRTPLDGPEFLRRVSYVNRAADDDRTILVVWSLRRG